MALRIQRLAPTDIWTPVARSLVALIITRATTLAYPELLPELAGQLEAHGFQALLSLIEHEGDVDRALAELAEVQLAGVIAAALPTDGALSSAAAVARPLLLYNCHASLTASVSCNHAACGRQLATMLLEAGHRRFGVISGPGDSFVSRERLAGVLEALVKPRVLVAEVVEGDYGYETGAAALDALFARMKPRPSAIIAMNDAMALGALDRARALQVRIPRDLSIVGMDGTTLAQLPVYQLATMRQPLRRMAAAAAQSLIARVEHPDQPVEVRLFGGEFIPGLTARFERPLRKTTAGSTTLRNDTRRSADKAR